MVRAAVPILALLLGVACGYRPMAVPEDAGSEIELRMLENRSAEPGVERLLADALHEEFQRRGALEPRTGARGRTERLVLQGVVREVNLQHSGFSSVALALEDQLEVILDVAVTRGSGGELVWARDAWAQRERFTASADPQVYQSNKTQALRRMAAYVASRIHDELLQSF